MNSYETVQLKGGKEKSLQRFHPWVFSGALAQDIKQFEQGSIVSDRVFRWASRHWWSDFARFVVITRPDTDSSSSVTVTLNLGMDRSIRACLISKSTNVVANFHLGTRTVIGWRDVVQRLATLEGFACNFLVGIKPYRLSVSRLLFQSPVVFLNSIRFTTKQRPCRIHMRGHECGDDEKEQEGGVHRETKLK